MFTYGMQAISMQRLWVNTFFFPAISCFITVLLGRLFFHLVHYSLTFPGSAITNCCLPWSCSLKCHFSSPWHTFVAQLQGSDVFPFPKGGASCWVVFHVWHSFCIRALLWQQCEKEHCSWHSSVSSWQCLELPSCFLKFLDASGVHLCFAGTAVWPAARNFVFSCRYVCLHN